MASVTYYENPFVHTLIETISNNNSFLLHLIKVTENRELKEESKLNN